MSNLADIIEKFILQRLSGEEDDIIVLRRNELAEEIECAPSQISYVLSTRFTAERGFIVESRRGSGGFVRIARLPAARIVIYEDQISPEVTVEDLQAMIQRLSLNGFLSKRETALLLDFAVIIYEKYPVQDRVPLFKSLLMTLAANS
ncbi:MAG: CtsR family transcriptional regulator [Pelosinus sp.]|nr:CtsR family transcriptional regulator [Pelosinus sp.]